MKVAGGQLYQVCSNRLQTKQICKCTYSCYSEYLFHVFLHISHIFWFLTSMLWQNNLLIGLGIHAFFAYCMHDGIRANPYRQLHFLLCAWIISVHLADIGFHVTDSECRFTIQKAHFEFVCARSTNSESGRPYIQCTPSFGSFSTELSPTSMFHTTKKRS